MTQDALPADRHLIGNLVEKLFSEPDLAACYARQLPKGTCGFLERYTRSFNYPEKDSVKRRGDLPKYGIKTYFCSNVCAAYRRDLFEENGGFVQRTIFNEDMIYAGSMIQKGYGIAYSAQAKVIHSQLYSSAAV
jgi:rhamnosyltransferase